MEKDKVLGAVMLVGGILALIVYVSALFFLGEFAWYLAISIVAFIAVAAVCGILAWIGYTLITTPKPIPIEEIEKEIEKEMSQETIEKQKT
jgi:predicted DNA-binding transcriptional regulator